MYLHRWAINFPFATISSLVSVLTDSFQAVSLGKYRANKYFGSTYEYLGVLTGTNLSSD